MSSKPGSRCWQGIEAPCFVDKSNAPGARALAACWPKPGVIRERRRGEASTSAPRVAWLDLGTVGMAAGRGAVKMKGSDER